MLLVRTYVAASPIQGVGLFAAEAIPKGALMWRFDPVIDIIVPQDKVAKLPPPMREFFDRYGYISPYFQGGYVIGLDNCRFINHSETPNTDNNSEFAHALRDIAAGEEITANYREFATNHEFA